MARKIPLFIQITLIPLLIAAILLVELKHPFAKFRLATLALVFALFVDLAILARGKTRNLMVVLASLVFGLSLAEAAAGAMTPRSVVKIDRGWSVRQPIMGWGPEKAGTYHAQMLDPSDNSIIYETDYTFDSDLLRHTVSADSGPAIVFFGDSFTFGDGVKNEETLPQDFADLTDRKLRVLNLALTGYSPQQFLREMETEPLRQGHRSRSETVRFPDRALACRANVLQGLLDRACAALCAGGRPRRLQGRLQRGREPLVARMARQLRPLPLPDRALAPQGQT